MIETNRKSVLLITRNFPPMLGGMEKLNQRMLEGLSKYRQAMLIAPKGARSFASEEVAVFEAPSANLPVFLLYAKFKAIWLAWSRKPDICLAGSGLTAPFAWLAARFSGARAGVYVHGLDLIADSRLYRMLWLPFIRCCDTVIANSANTKRLAVSAGVLQERISIVHPGTDIPELNPTKALAFRQRYGLGDSPLLLSVGRITERKGLLPFLQRCWPLILQNHPDAKFVVIGGEPLQALRKDRRSTLADTTAYLAESGLTGTVQFLGRVNDETLVSAYQAADVHVFPVLESADDVEGFGMVVIEAAANGLPTVAFDAGGVADAVEDNISGQLLALGDYPAFTQAVLTQLASGRTSQSVKMCRTFAEKRSWVAFHAGIEGALQHDRI